jgi:hypothetical protein
MQSEVYDGWGIVPLSERELLTNGGAGKLKKLVEIIGAAMELLQKAEKYWPNFRDGFKKGWEAA